MQTEVSGVVLSDESFLTQFENQTLNPIHFKHIDHLRLTWLYLRGHDVEKAAELVGSGVKAYATSLGADTKFHVTITDALVRIMAQRVAQLEKREWQLFLEQNSDLVDDALSVLAQHFTEDLLFSEAARTSLVQPDLKPL